MSEMIQRVSIQQQRKRAKELLKAAKAGNAQSILRLQKVRPSHTAFQLADAQLAIAREQGFDSWPKLVAHIKKQHLNRFRDAVDVGDVETVRHLLDASAYLRRKINAPLFSFGQRAINAASSNLDLVDVLMEYGADINLRSDWKAGPFGIMDACPADIAAPLIHRGARLTAHAAARLGWIDELRKLLAANAEVVHEKGGDGQRPLHYALTPDICNLLLLHGADINARCVDHESTAAQYALKDRPEVTAHLLQRGATPDIFMAARLGDISLAKQLVDQNPTCLLARTGTKGYEPVAASGIYNWILGFHLSPHEVAFQFEKQNVYALLLSASSLKVQFLTAILTLDSETAFTILGNNSFLLTTLSAEDHSLLAHAAANNRDEVFDLMLDVGFDPMARGFDGGTVLHMAAWVANVHMIQALLNCGVDHQAHDPAHGSTPLGWAAYGSVHRRCKGGDYPAAIELLVRCGSDIKGPGNKYGATLIDMADGNEAVQNVLRQLGA